MHDSWDSERYDENHSFVYEESVDLVGILEPSPGDRVLDLGCGTGGLSAELADRGADVVGIDKSPRMIARARERHDGIEFEVADARTFETDRRFDAVLSNAVLHWITRAEQPAVLRRVARVLRPEGRFVAELGGRNNVATVVAALRSELSQRGYDTTGPWYFPRLGEYAAMVEDAGLEVTNARLYDRPTPLEGGAEGLADWLSMFGEGWFGELSTHEKEMIIDGVAERVRSDLFDETADQWVIDYRRLQFVARQDPNLC